MKISTRYARPSDLTDVLAMIQALSAFHGHTAETGLETLQALFFGPSPAAVAMIATVADRPVGYAGLVCHITLHAPTPRLDIQHLFVHEAFRSKGVGKALIAAAREHATGIGARGLTISTDPDNKTAQAAYSAMGLEDITGKIPRFWIPANDPAV